MIANYDDVDDLICTSDWCFGFLSLLEVTDVCSSSKAFKEAAFTNSAWAGLCRDFGPHVALFPMIVYIFKQ